MYFVQLVNEQVLMINHVQLIAAKFITIPLPGGVVDAFYRLNMVIFVLFVGYEKWQISNMKRIYLRYNKIMYKKNILS